jgi:hypothetical protein
MIDDDADDCGVVGEVNEWQGKPKYSDKTLSQCRSGHRRFDLPWPRTRASAVGNRRQPELRHTNVLNLRSFLRTKMAEVPSMIVTWFELWWGGGVGRGLDTTVNKIGASIGML